MSYIEKNLMNGENIVYRTHLHWVIFLWPIVCIAVAIFLFSLGAQIAVAAGGLFLLTAIREPYHRIHAPLEFRKRVQEQIASADR